MRARGGCVWALVALVACGMCVSARAEEAKTIELHGSGTSNPSKLIWKLMDQMEVQARVPVLMTYRSVGSGVGISEFVNYPSYTPINDFGCADVPLPAEEYNNFTSNADALVHVPIALGAIGIFHSVPFDGLRLTPCLLSKVFQRNITTWNHQAILAENPGLENVLPANQNIFVVHRTKGSSSTAGTTEYLKVANQDNADTTCSWELEAGQQITWDPSTITADPDNSDGMVDTIRNTQYAIGYIDAGHGHDARLKEVTLQNKAQKWVTSEQVGMDGISAAGAAATTPTSGDADFSGVQLYNMDGDNTWPIVSMSYFFVRKNLTGLGSTGPLLKAFIEYVNSDAGQEEVQKFKFAPLPQSLRDMNTATLESLSVAETESAWIFEDSTLANGEGAGDRVFSSKRMTYAEYERSLMQTSLESLQTQTAALTARAAHELHGSGTTNPSKFFWKVMDLMEEQAKLPLFMTYRAVGSSTGQKEFVGTEANNFQPLNHFGSGDIPMTQDLYESITAAHEMLHIPFVLGAISFFHSIPTADQPAGGVRLSACLMSKIFQGRITTWDDDAIMAENPDLRGKVPANQRITVVHRTLGSSSTAGASEYLQKANKGSSDSQCKWDLNTGSTVNWPQNNYFISEFGSDGVAGHIDANPYSIGYLDAGHGHDLGLSEIALRNADGGYLTSKEADIGAAATQAIADNVIPADGSASFAEVNLYNLPGPTTWPITMMSYIYLRKDVSSLGDTSTLLKAFVTYILSEEGQDMVEEFGFSKMPQAVLDLNSASLASMVTDPTAPEWKFEEGGDSPDPMEGAGEYVLSGKRRSYAEYERNLLASQVADQKAQIEDLKAQIAAMKITDADHQPELDHDDPENDDHIHASEIAGILGLVFAVIALILSAYNTYISVLYSNTGLCAAPCAAPDHVKLDEVAI